MRYVSGEEILAIHSEIIDATGGSHGVRDTHLLLSLVEKPKGRFGRKELYKTVFDKAAAYLESIVHYHVFVDGNKRTGFVVSARFLSVNGFELTVSNEAAEHFVMKIVIEKPAVLDIARWFKKNSKKIKIKLWEIKSRS